MCCIALFLNSFVVAKSYDFRVLASKGTVQVQKDASKNWDKLNTGATLNKNDKIKLAQKSYLSLVHSSGKTMEIKAQGSYNISDLASKVSAMKSNVSQRFANYVIDEISSSKDMLAKGNYKENMETTGSTERGMAHFNPKKIKDDNQPFMNKDSYISINFPRKVNFLNQDFTITWNKNGNNKEYEFQIADRFDKPIFTKTVSDTSISLSASALKLEKDVYYFWKVCLKNNSKVKSDDACFLVLSDKKATAIRDTVKLINEEMGAEKTATSSIILASFYEQNYIIDEAIKSYRAAIDQAPDVPEYQNMFKRFMKRIQVSNN
jgi:hypothetical protein